MIPGERVRNVDRVRSRVHGLQDARRDVTRVLEVMRHAARERGPERGFGPSRYGSVPISWTG